MIAPADFSVDTSLSPLRSTSIDRNRPAVTDGLTKALRTNANWRDQGIPLIFVLVDRLLAIPTITTEAGRRLVMDHMRPEIANAVPHFSQNRLQVVGLLRTCMNYPGGVEELLRAIRILEGDSTPVRLLDATVARLLSEVPD